MIVHAYGAEGGGYIFSWGIAREVSEIIAEHFTYKNSGSTEATTRSKL